jgi:hypothetical protein
MSKGCGRGGSHQSHSLMHLLCPAVMAQMITESTRARLPAVTHLRPLLRLCPLPRTQSWLPVAPGSFVATTITDRGYSLEGIINYCHGTLFLPLTRAFPRLLTRTGPARLSFSLRLGTSALHCQAGCIVWVENFKYLLLLCISSSPP